MVNCHFILSAGIFKVGCIYIGKIQTADEQRTERDSGRKQLNVILSKSPDRIKLILEGELLTKKVEALSGGCDQVGVVLCDDKGHRLTHTCKSHRHYYRYCHNNQAEQEYTQEDNCIECKCKS